MIFLHVFAADSNKSAPAAAQADLFDIDIISNIKDHAVVLKAAD